MSLGLEEGSEQNAPLGRAVMGGMACSTFAALLVLPAMFTYIMAGATKKSASLDPDDPASSHYDPEHAPGHEQVNGQAHHSGSPLANGQDHSPSQESPDHVLKNQ